MQKFAVRGVKGGFVKKLFAGTGIVDWSNQPVWMTFGEHDKLMSELVTHGYCVEGITEDEYLDELESDADYDYYADNEYDYMDGYYDE